MDRLSAHMDRSWDLLAKGKTSMALVSAVQALKISGNSPEIFNLIGYIHAIEGNFERAIENYREAIELDEWYLEPLLNSAELLAHPDADPAEAIAMCKKATELNLTPQEYADTILIEVEALLNTGQDKLAKERIGDLDEPETLAVTYQTIIARALLDAGAHNEARAFIERAILLDESLPDVWYILGLICKEEGKRIESVNAFIKTRHRDLGTPRLPWSLSREEVNHRIKYLIEKSEGQIKQALGNAQIIVEDYPSEEQISLEIDPRQVFFAEGIDIDCGSFRKLWVFSLNLERVVAPTDNDHEIRFLLASEILGGNDQDLSKIKQKSFDV